MAEHAEQQPAAAGDGAADSAGTGAAESQSSHGSDIPKALETFMLQGWREPSLEPPAPVARIDAYRARRATLSRAFPGEVLIIPTGHEKVRANSTFYRFRPGSDFYYLTGNHEPDCVLVMEPQLGGGHRDVLFVEPSTRDDITFFQDHAKGELWVGARLGVDRSRVRYGVDDCQSLRALPAYLNALASRLEPVRTLRGLSAEIDDSVVAAASPSPSPSNDIERDSAFAAYLSEMRLIKDALEIEELQAVVDATRRGFEDVIRSLRTARSEREVECTFFVRARTEGNDVGYGAIAAAGAHACILHWTRNDGALRQGELLLLDAGVEGHALYTADITRTVPISGTFSETQRQVYDLVYAAQQAAIAAIRPGIDFMEPNRVAMAVLAHGLEALGLLPVPARDALREDQQLYRRYTLHNISHMLGIDVHDCAKARQETYKHGKLQPGMVFTIEPGLYFQADDLTVPERFRGIGVRIEDDVVVTERGCRVLSAGIPGAADDVEAWIARLWREA